MRVIGNTDMHNTEKKLHRQASERSGLSRKDMGSKINTSNKNSGKISYSKKYKPKQRSHVKTIDSILSKRRVSEFSSNGTRNNSLSQKPVKRKTVQRFSDTNSPSRQLTAIVQGGKSSIRRRRGHGKNPVGESGTQKVDRRKRRKRSEENKGQDETSRLQRRTRYLLIKMKLEQSLLDAYSGEGWKGQSREKIKPVRELQRAKKQILKCKLGIRDIARQLDLLSSEGCIEESVFGPDGSVFHEHIFCAKCKLRDAFPDNDIILCDGTCNCAFHQKCLEPPLATENIPPEDQGWFCKFCECKIEIIEGINAHLGTHFSASSNWQDIFKEAATTCDGDNAFLNPEDEWPSDEPEDDDYDPERNEGTCSRTGSEDSVHDEASSSSSFFWTSDEEASLQSRQLEADGSPNGGFYQGRRRQRNDVDYKKLHDEMFGKDGMENEPVSEDEDWGPGRQRRRLNETDAAGSLVALCEIGDGPSVMPEKPKKKLPSVKENRRTLFRIPPNAVEKLRSVFAENELPSRAVKENLSKQLGLASEKVNKWFKNARYAAIKNRKAGEVERYDTTTTIANESTSAIRKNQSPDPVASKANSHLVQSDTGVPIPKSLRRVRRRKNSNSIAIFPKKKQHRRTSIAVQTNINEQVSSWFSNAVSFKRKVTKLRENSIKQKQVKSKQHEKGISKNNEQLYMTEMERLCRLEAKLAEMKEVLLRITHRKNHVSDPAHSDDRHVMYVPVVEVKEKKKVNNL